MSSRSPLGNAPLQIVAVALTDRGKVRRSNEDAVGVFPAAADSGERLLVVADGLGGGQGGSTASAMAVEVLRESLVTAPLPADVPGALAAAFLSAHRRILERAEKDFELFGMGTTCTAAFLRGSRLYLGHTGDTRAYLLREDVLHRLTEDHTARTMAVDAAGTRVEGAGRNLLGSYLGSSSPPRVDVTGDPRPLLPGDALLLCSDGLHGVLEESALRSLLGDGEPEAAARALIAAALDAGGPDNVSAVVAAIRG